METDIPKLMDLVRTLTKENLEFRTFLWQNHGHDELGAGGLYSGEGEMQCAMCELDYKRDSLERITSVWEKVMKYEN